METDELLTAVSPIIGQLGWSFYFAPATLAVGAELGLDGLQFYVAGRGGVLGDVEGSVVHAAFGYFNPALISQTWAAATAICPARAAGRAFHECCAEHGRRALADVPGLDGFVAAADAVIDAADPTALALFAGIAAEPLVDDLPGRAMQQLAVLRELRGSAHLVALRASGIDTKTAHFVKRPNDIRLFGWTDGDAPTITDETHTAMARAEALTDAIVAPAFAVLDDAGRDALVAGLAGAHQALTS